MRLFSIGVLSKNYGCQIFELENLKNPCAPVPVRYSWDDTCWNQISGLSTKSRLPGNTPHAFSSSSGVRNHFPLPLIFYGINKRLFFFSEGQNKGSKELVNYFGVNMTSVNKSGAPAESCSTLCGMCWSCVFAPEPPGSARCLWTVSDELRRNLVVGLILRCTSVNVLQTIQEALSFTSWDYFNYDRSESRTCVLHFSSAKNQAWDVKPEGLDVAEIWAWFTGSSHATKSRYLLRLFSFCDSELLRMAANLTNVLLVRQRRGLLQMDGKD